MAATERRTIKTQGGRPRKKTRKKRKIHPLRVEWWWVAALFALGAIIYVLAVLPERSRGEGHALVPEGAYAFGIDISHNNKGPIVWDSLCICINSRGRTVRDMSQARRIEPVSFVFIKASEGVSMKDPDFIKNWESALSAGIPRGPYHFYRTSRDPARQAENFIAATGPIRFKDLPPVLDIETTHRGLTKEKLNSDLLIWLGLVEKHYGRKPVIYTSDSFARDWLSPSIKAGYPLWIAHYRKEPPYTEGWTWWQFTDRGTVYGAPGHVDISVRMK
ncbi:MAG: hypothetical protein II151_04915 [Bacteroidales bacterium]|nr:hypothetical protein [Bacteroidales bacterium]MBQ4286968.1 hypothetical protein [Bacteroidales bacterium]